MTEAFLRFTVEAGNDLVTPRPEFNFPGLVPGDRWCLCAGRWLEAASQGKAPLIVGECTNRLALLTIPEDILLKNVITIN